MTARTLGQCGSCGAPVEWAVTEHGKSMPIDPDPRPDGNIVILSRFKTDGRPLVAYITAGPPDRLFEPDQYVSHFATCPDADRWRKPRTP